MTIGETKVAFECLSQLAHKQLGTTTPVFQSLTLDNYCTVPNVNLTYNVIIVVFQSYAGIYGSLERLLQQVCKGHSLFQYIETYIT